MSNEPHASASDPKQGEREYYARIGEAGMTHALGKPFSDAEHCNIHLANLAVIFQLLPPPTGETRIIELGCGVGWLSLLMARRGYLVNGYDIAPEAIAAAENTRDDAGVTGLTYQVGDYEALEFGGRADAVLFYDALHHAEDPSRALQCACRALRPGGMLIAFEPGEGHHDTARAKQIIAEFGVHENDMPPKRIIALGRRAGFTRHLCLPSPWPTLRTLYRPGYATGRTTGELRAKYRLGGASVAPATARVPPRHGLRRDVEMSPSSPLPNPRRSVHSAPR